MTRDLVLRQHQEYMLEFALARQRSALWAEPGLGKSATALSLIMASLFDFCDTSRWLIVGPKLVVEDTWPRQLATWTQFAGLSSRLLTSADFGLKAGYEAIDETRRQRVGLTFGERADKALVKRQMLSSTEHIHLCPYHLLPWLVKSYGRNVPYDGIILDESLSVADSSSERHRAVWHMAERLQCVKRMLLLTGTPDPNSLAQLHGQIRLLDGGERLGKTKTDFMAEFMVPDRIDPRRGRVWSWKPAAGARVRVQERIADVCVSLRADDWLDLPPLMVNPIYVPLPPALRAKYDELEEQLIILIGEGRVLAPGQGVLASKLRQLANGAVYLTDTERDFVSLSDFKLDRLEDIANETAEPLLVLYQFESDWLRMQKRFGKLVRHVSKDKGALNDFRARKVKMLCAHASGTEGVDGLQEVCSTMVWLGATFDARHWLQSLARLRRDGSTAERVIAHQLLASDTVEERYAGEVLPERVEEQEALLNALAWRAKVG